MNTCEDQQQSKVMCIECETLYDMDEGDDKWIECEVCLNGTTHHALELRKRKLKMLTLCVTYATKVVFFLF